MVALTLCAKQAQGPVLLRQLRSRHTMTFWSTVSERLKLNVEEHWCQ